MPEVSEPVREPAPGLEPGTARLQGGCNPPHPAPTSDSGHAAVPARCLNPHGLTPFRVTNHVTLDHTRSWSALVPIVASVVWSQDGESEVRVELGAERPGDHDVAKEAGHRRHCGQSGHQGCRQAIPGRALTVGHPKGLHLRFLAGYGGSADSPHWGGPGRRAASRGYPSLPRVRRRNASSWRRQSRHVRGAVTNPKGVMLVR